MTSKLLGPLAFLCALAAIPSFANTKPLSLSEGFFSCVDLPKVPVAASLMRSVWNPEVRADFMKVRHFQVQPNSLTFAAIPSKGTEGLTTASVSLKPTAKFGGVVAKSLSATTCASGCGAAYWELNFGVLGDKDVQRFKSWISRAPVTEDEVLGQVKVTLEVNEDKNARLVCELSI